MDTKKLKRQHNKVKARFRKGHQKPGDYEKLMALKKTLGYSDIIKP
jgi:hypothetical protein